MTFRFKIISKKVQKEYLRVYKLNPNCIQKSKDISIIKMKKNVAGEIAQPYIKTYDKAIATRRGG